MIDSRNLEMNEVTKMKRIVILLITCTLMNGIVLGQNEIFSDDVKIKWLRVAGIPPDQF